MKGVKPNLKSETLVFNPYPVLGCPSQTCWPRGFPLNEIQNQDTFEASFDESVIPLKSFGVLQSLADIQPDLDAIYRMTQKTPFVFQKPKFSSKFHYCVVRVQGSISSTF